MGTQLADIGYDLIEGIFTVLDGHLSCPVYKSIPKPPATKYVHIHQVQYVENGTKDDFIYEGTVLVEVVDESRHRIDKKDALTILGDLRSHLKPSKGSVFSVGTKTLVVFSLNAYNEVIEPADNGITKLRLVDMYNFIIE